MKAYGQVRALQAVGHCTEVCVALAEGSLWSLVLSTALPYDLAPGDSVEVTLNGLTIVEVSRAL